MAFGAESVCIVCFMGNPFLLRIISYQWSVKKPDLTLIVTSFGRDAKKFAFHVRRKYEIKLKGETGQSVPGQSAAKWV